VGESAVGGLSHPYPLFDYHYYFNYIYAQRGIDKIYSFLTCYECPLPAFDARRRSVTEQKKYIILYPEGSNRDRVSRSSSLKLRLSLPMAWEAKAVGEKLSIPHSAPGTGTYTERSAYDLSTPNLLVKCDRSNL
jgi:hypothetical protein